MNFEQKLNIVIDEIATIYNLSNEQANLIKNNIVSRVQMYQNVHPNFSTDETKIVINSSSIGDFFINRLVTNVRNYDFDQTYSKDNTIKGTYTSNDQSLYIGSYKFIKDITRDKLKNRINNLSDETLRKASLNVLNHEVGHALQTAFKGKNGKNDIRYIRLISNLSTKYPDDFKLQSTEEMLTTIHKGMEVTRKDDKSREARKFYAPNAYTTNLDEIFNEDEALRITGVTNPQFSYNLGSGFSKNIYNYQSSNYKITSYGRMMKIVMGEDLTFKAMYEDSIIAYEFFDQFKDISDKIYQGKPPMFNILESLNKIKSESSLNESQKLDLFLTVCLQKRVMHELKNPELTQKDIGKIKNYISEFNSQRIKNSNLVLQQDYIISNINNMVSERERQLENSIQKDNVQDKEIPYRNPKTQEEIQLSNNKSPILEETKNEHQKSISKPKEIKDYNYYFNEMLTSIKKYNHSEQMTEAQKKQLIGEIFYNESYLIELLTNDEEIKQVIIRSINELGANKFQIRLQNIILTELQEKYKSLHPEIKSQKPIAKKENKDNNSKHLNDKLNLSKLTDQLMAKLTKVQETYHSMMSDKHIDEEELATLIAMNNKIIDAGYSLKKLATDSDDLRKVNVIINNLEEQQKKMKVALNSINESEKTI